MVVRQDLPRFERQTAIPELGEEGQRRLRGASAVVVGMGGMGSAAALYLAAAGVGRLLLVDCGRIAMSDLNRQPLFTPGDVGKGKVSLAARRLRRTYPDVEFGWLDVRVSRDNVERLVQRGEVVLDCLDDPSDQLLLNRACIAHSIPLVHAACCGFEARLLTVLPGRTACLACLQAEDPARSAQPVLGAAAGSVGCMQAVEAIKLLLGRPSPSIGRLVILDLLAMTMHQRQVPQLSECPACAKPPTGE